MSAKSLLIRVLAPIAVSISSLAFAGGGSSGGGLLLKDAHNPWFLQNIPSVKYCILVDREHFPVKKSRLKSLIAKSLNFWKGEFKDRRSGFILDGVSLAVATQDFIYKESCEDVSVRFQFGYLTDSQLQMIKDPKKVIGLAVRTEYDRKSMSGKGFLYISPETGPLAPDIKNIQPRRWQIENNNLLYLALVHELGHVFGIPDFPASSGSWLMGINMLEKLTRQRSENLNLAQFKLLFFNPNKFRFHSGLDFQGNHPDHPSKELSFFGIKRRSGSLRYQSHKTGYKVSIGPYQSNDENEYQILGEIILKKTFKVIKKPTVSVWFPPEQEVFKPGEYDQDVLSTHFSLYPRTATQFDRALYRGVNITAEKQLLIETSEGVMEGISHIGNGTIEKVK